MPPLNVERVLAGDLGERQRIAESSPDPIRHSPAMTIAISPIAGIVDTGHASLMPPLQGLVDVHPVRELPTHPIASHPSPVDLIGGGESGSLSPARSHRTLPRTSEPPRSSVRTTP